MLVRTLDCLYAASELANIPNLFRVFQLVGKPVETLVESIPGCGARRLDVPVPLSQSVKTQFVWISAKYTDNNKNVKGLHVRLSMMLGVIVEWRNGSTEIIGCLC